MGGFAWVTLATNDSYSLGALVLGHSLRRAGTPHDLVVLVTPGVSQTMRNQLSTVFTLVQEVNILDSKDEANLALLERPDLGITFTKLHCWRLTQYEKCVFLDADTLVLKNSDELFEREELSAAPDPGWPDCFNSGVFVYRPSQDTFNALVKFALAKGSFDGGDQGLLNMYFSDWATKDISKHLPFIYNMVSTATYSYLPAYKQFGESAKIVHFIGANKPWLQYFDTETKLARSPTGSEHMQPLLQLWWDIFCSTVHPSLSPDMLGLAGALAQLTLGVPRTTEQTVFEEHMRRQAWEQGTMDYMGRDSFDNIWRKITDTLAQAPTKPATEEVPPIQPASEPKLPESIPPAPKSRKSPPADTSEAPGLSSSAEPTSNQSSQDTETPPEGKSIEPSPLSSIDITPPKSAPEQAKPVPVVPHTPSIIEATPPTSPPIVIPTAPIADIQALKVNAPQPATPPVGSSPSELGSDTQLKTAQTIESHEQALPTSKDSNLQQSTPVPEQSTLAEKKVSSDTLESVQTSSQEVPALKEITSSLVSTPGEVPVSSAVKETPIVSSDSQIPSTQDTSIKGDASVPMKEVMDKTEGQKDSSVSPLVHKTEISISQSTDATQVPSSGGIEVKSSAEQIVPISQPTDEAKVPSVGATDVQSVEGKEVPAHEIASAATEVKLVLEKEVTIPQQVVGSQIPSEMKHATDEVAVSQKVLEPPIPASPITEVKPATVVPTEPSTPSSPISEVKPATVVPITQQVVEPPTPASPLTEVKPATVVQTTQQVVEPPTPASPLTEVKPATVVPTTQQVVEPPTPASPLTEVKPATVVPTTQQVVEPPTPASPLTEVKPATVVPTTQQVVEPPTPASPLTEVKPATVVPTTQQVVEPQIPISAVTEVKLPKKEIPVSPTAQKVQAPASPPPSSNQTQDSKSQSSENTVPEDPKAQSVPAQVVKTKEEVKSAGKKPSIELKTASVESTQSEQVPKSPSSKSSAPGSAPSTPDVAPPDQAPIPPKRRGHKGAGAAAASEQGAASKPAAQSQTQQTKGSKGQKGKK